MYVYWTVGLEMRSIHAKKKKLDSTLTYPYTPSPLLNTRSRERLTPGVPQRAQTRVEGRDGDSGSDGRHGTMAGAGERADGGLLLPVPAAEGVRYNWVCVNAAAGLSVVWFGLQQDVCMFL